MKVATDFKFQPRSIRVPLVEFTEQVPLPIQVLHFLEQVEGFSRFSGVEIRINPKWVTIKYLEFLR
jgi:hypothetical protein